MVDLDKKGATVKIRDFVKDLSCKSPIIFNGLDVLLGYNQDLLFVANSNTIKIVDAKVEVAEGGSTEINVADGDIQTYEIKAPCKLLQFFENGFSRYD